MGSEMCIRDRFFICYQNIDEKKKKKKLSLDLDAVQRWASNKMFINKKKTKSLLVHGNRIPAKLDDDTPLR